MDDLKILESLAKSKELAIVGRGVHKIGATDIVLGKTKYTADRLPENTLHVATVRAAHPHAIIKRIDSSEATKHGYTVVTAADVPGVNEIGFFAPDQPVLAFDKVRYLGDGVALVVAGSLEKAQAARDLVSVDYEPLPAVFSPIDAMRPDAPKVHERGNVLETHYVRKGNTEKGFRTAKIVIEREYSTQFQDHGYLEPETALAIPQEDDSMTVVGSMQCPHHVEMALYRVFGGRLKNVSVIQAPTGGGFGGKEDWPNETCSRAALAAWKTNRPCLLVQTREESMIGHTKRHPFLIKSKMGVGKDGRITSVVVKMTSDTGAYASLGPRVLWNAVVAGTGPYEIPNVSVDGTLVYTNNTPAGANRGFGKTQAHFAAECLVDEAAHELGMDPLEFRLKNALRVGSKTATGQVLERSSGVGLVDTIRKTAAASSWKKRDHEKLTGTKRRGIGMACLIHGTSIGPLGDDFDCASVTVNRDASIVIRTGIADIGQGTWTGMSQIVAEILGVPLSWTTVENPVNTSTAPDSAGTFASRGQVMGGNAVALAASHLNEKLVKVAASLLKRREREIVMRDGKVFRRGKPSTSMTFRELTRRCYRQGVGLSETTWFDSARAGEQLWGEKASWDRKTGQGRPYLSYSFATHVAEVEVDTETGKVDVVRYVACHDAGRVINRMLAEGQVHGGVAYGLGYALMEETLHEKGKVLNPNLLDYYIPTSLDVPDQIVPILVEHPASTGPFGAKGLGEPPAEIVAPAVANAVFNAVGVRIRHLPITSEKVYFALKGGRT